MQDFRNLRVWRNAHLLAVETYAFSASLSHPRHFFLRDQMVRAAVSVPTNIAEGCGRGSDREFRKFLRIALGSASELEYHFLFAHDLGLLPKSAYEKLTAATTEVKRMLAGLASRLSEKLKAES